MTIIIYYKIIPASQLIFHTMGWPRESRFSKLLSCCECSIIKFIDRKTYLIHYYFRSNVASLKLMFTSSFPYMPEWIGHQIKYPLSFPSILMPQVPTELPPTICQWLQFFHSITFTIKQTTILLPIHTTETTIQLVPSPHEFQDLEWK